MTATVRRGAVDRQPRKIDREAANTNTSVNIGQQTLGMLLKHSIRRLEAHYGLKNLIDYFDGRDGESVAPSTVSKWYADPGRVPAWTLPIFAELDPAFRADVIGLLLSRISSPAELIRLLPPKVGAQVARAHEALIVRHLRRGEQGRLFE